MTKIDKYTVVVDGVPITRINPTLVAKQKLSDEVITKIVELHKERVMIEGQLALLASESNHVGVMRFLVDWSNNQYALQEAWGFQKDSRYHRFWDIPGCSCPRFDNSDRYPSLSYIYNEDCPIHGW